MPDGLALPFPGMQGGKPFVCKRDFALSKRFGATGAEIFIKILVGQDKQQPFPHWHRLSTFAAIESGCLEGFKLFHTSQ